MKILLLALILFSYSAYADTPSVIDDYADVKLLNRSCLEQTQSALNDNNIEYCECALLEMQINPLLMYSYKEFERKENGIELLSQVFDIFEKGWIPSNNAQAQNNFTTATKAGLISQLSVIPTDACNHILEQTDQAEEAFEN
ncbi:MAG: hypothetical protein AB8B83_03540 [Bdellovibrionales bacterium]